PRPARSRYRLQSSPQSPHTALPFLYKPSPPQSASSPQATTHPIAPLLSNTNPPPSIFLAAEPPRSQSQSPAERLRQKTPASQTPPPPPPRRRQLAPNPSCQFSPPAAAAPHPIPRFAQPSPLSVAQKPPPLRSAHTTDYSRHTPPKSPRHQSHSRVR